MLRSSARTGRQAVHHFHFRLHDTCGRRCTSKYTSTCLTSHRPSSHLAMTSTLSSSSNFQSIFDAALSEYAKQTGIDLTVHPYAQTLQNSSSADAILALLEDKAKQFQAYRDGNRKLINCLKPVVQVLHTVSTILGEAATSVSLMNRGILYDRILTVLFPGSVPTYKSNLCWCRCPSHCA